MNSTLKGFAATVLIVLIPLGLASVFGKHFSPLVLLGAGIALIFPLLMPRPNAFLGSIFGFLALATLVTLNYVYLDIARQAGSIGDDGGGGEAMAKVMYTFYFFAALVSVGLRTLGGIACNYFQVRMKAKVDDIHTDGPAA